MGALLSAATLSFSDQVALSRLNSLARVLKGQSRALSESCAAKVLLNYALDPSYAGHETIIINETQCAVGELALTADTLTTTTSVNLNSIISTIQTIANKNDTTIVSQHEIIN
jgi:hypothetical protein